ncbi:uncharacterized protein LOC125232207 isoform X1 [Leguminivora glycinivorella]|uniref:uncharacterized protein LOC125232207 isoform X1 n=1 Tax=Leguminivora glycinivorella TaxID=1035111 RepID=UPI00200F436E|nr:uncharacterized protein LOC125232207 isoform X1 [Leguminivora glycinivorella]
MSHAINKLLELGAISQCNPSSDQFVSKIFLTPKPNGDKRFILNLKSLNTFIPKIHFKMEDHRTASKLIPQNSYLANIDLKEAYLLIPIHVSDRKYLRFQFQAYGSKEILTYEFNALPYGLSLAPWVFTKVMKEVITYLRSNGLKSVMYLDDILCIGDDYPDCIRNVNETVKLLQCLGFVINFSKSSLEPKHSCKFLGFIFDTRNMSMSLPNDKRNKIAQLVNKFMKLPRCSIREFAQLIGVLVAACPAVKYGWLYTKILERQKFLFLQKHNDNFEAKISLPNIICTDLDWWNKNIATANNPMRTENFKYEIFTDASRSGWGAVCGNKRVNGLWKIVEMEYHINYLELFAVFLALKSLAADVTNCAILLRIDNTTAISYINRMGGIQFPHLNDLARSIWQWCEERHIWLYASYVNTKHNYADEESRKINPDTEWELSAHAFDTIIKILGNPDVDLFASRANAKCDVFVSWRQEPDAMAVDAFTLNWSSSFFYAFPPFSLVLKCLRKIVDDKADGILVFPYWPSQAWFPFLTKLLKSEIIIFNPHKQLLKSHFRDHHPLHASLTLGAARLCGRRSSSGEPLLRQYL